MQAWAGMGARCRDCAVILVAIARKDFDLTIVSVKPKRTGTAVARNTIHTRRSILAWQRHTLVYVNFTLQT